MWKFSGSAKRKLSDIEGRINSAVTRVRKELTRAQRDLLQAKQDIAKVAEMAPACSPGEISELCQIADLLKDSVVALDRESAPKLEGLAGEQEQLRGQLSTAKRRLALANEIRRLVVELGDLGGPLNNGQGA